MLMEELQGGRSLHKSAKSNTLESLEEPSCQLYMKCHEEFDDDGNLESGVESGSKNTQAPHLSSWLP